MKLLLILTIGLNLFAQASSKIINSEIKFLATGKPSFIKASGKLDIEKADITLKEGKLSGSFIVDLNKLNSGIELRDEHLKEKYLEVKKYPQAILTFEGQALELENNSQTVKAKLNLHGETKDIELKIETAKEDKVLKIIAEFNIELSMFKIELPSFQGITAANKVKINVDSEVEL